MVEQQKADLEALALNLICGSGNGILHQGRELVKVIQFMQEAGFLYEQDGAVWFASTRFGDDKDHG